jgi:hypothetical protein
MTLLAKLEMLGIILAIAALAAFGWGAHKKHEGVMEERGRWEVKQAAATSADLTSLKQAIDTSAGITAATLAELQKKKAATLIDRGVIEREIKTDVRYTTDCGPDSGRVQWNAISAGNALVPGSAAGLKPDPAVPQGNQRGDPGVSRPVPLAKPPAK